MSEHSQKAEGKENMPRATIKKSRLHWLFWLIPIGAAALCVWFIFRDYIATGPLITIYFQNADGLEEGNTSVKFRGAQVGRVKTIALLKDNRFVKVQARLESSASQLARQGSVFWIVRPEVKVGAISGLRTIVSGEYIAVQPGNGAATNWFAGVEKEPVTAPPGSIQITLHATDLNSLEDNSPVFYRGVQVGQVLRYKLGPGGRDVMVQAQINGSYALLVRTNSKFWNAGGVSFRFGLFRGLEVGAESAKTLFSGGIEFATPPDFGPPAASGDVFALHEKPDDAWKKWSPTIPMEAPAPAEAGDEKK